MMHDRPSDPEYCQSIYDAATKIVLYWNGDEKMEYDEMEKLMDNLKRALEGKG